MRARQTAVAALVALALLAGGLAGGSASAQMPPGGGAGDSEMVIVEAPGRAPEVEAGLALYQEHCVRCHGPRGRGQGELRGELPAPPPSFADPDYMRTVTPEGAFEIVTAGRLDRLMPPWRDELSVQERWDVIYGAWSFYYTPDRLNRAADAWSARCAECHTTAEPVPFERFDWWLARSQADVFAAVRGSAAHRGVLDDADEAALQLAVDHARAASFDPITRDELALDGTIVGRVRNGTAGVDDVAGAVVRVVPFGATVPLEPVTATVGAGGVFTATGLLTGPQSSYGIVASYEGADYIHPAAVPLESGGARSEVDLTVYATATDVPLAVEEAHVVLAPAPQQGVLRVVEVWQVANETDRTAVGGDGVTLELPLLPGAQALEFGDPRLSDAAQRTGDRVRADLAVPPGGAQIEYSYVVPYQGTSMDIERPVTMPTRALRVLVDAPDARVESARLTEPQTIEVDQRAVTGARGRDFAPGDVIPVRIEGLPAPEAGAVQTALQAAPPPVLGQSALAGIGLAVGLTGLLVALGYPLVVSGRGTRRRAARLAAERQRLVRQVAALDQRHRAGAIDPERYAEQRAALMDRAMTVTRALREARGDQASGDQPMADQTKGEEGT